MPGTDTKDQTTGTTEFREGQDWQPQPGDDLFRQMFAGGQGQPIPAADMSQHYFDLADAVLRTARRVSEVQVLYAWRQQIVSEAAVLAERRLLTRIQQDPTLIRQSSSR